MNNILKIAAVATLLIGGVVSTPSFAGESAGVQTYTKIAACLVKQAKAGGGTFVEGKDFRQKPNSSDHAGMVQSHSVIKYTTEWANAKKACGVKAS